MSIKSKLKELKSFIFKPNDKIYKDREEAFQDINYQVRQELLAKLDRRIKKRTTSQGLVKFTYGKNYLYARDKENADRKAKKRGWIMNLNTYNNEL